MNYKKFTTNRGVIKIKSNNALVWCDELKDWMESDKEKYNQEMKLNKIEQGY